MPNHLIHANQRAIFTIVSSQKLYPFTVIESTYILIFSTKKKHIFVIAGSCVEFARALLDIFPYDGYQLVDSNDCMAHVYCVFNHKKFGTLYIDARGITNDYHRFLNREELTSLGPVEYLPKKVCVCIN